MEISVIMLTYNRENMLGNMIQCILGQTFSDFEFIIVDNGSLDRSGEIADDFAENDKRIRVIHLPKSSIGKGRNAGLDIAIGEYVAFVDDDDLCSPDYLETLHDNILKKNADVSICGAKDKAFSINEVYSNTEALEILLDRKYFNVAFPTKLIKRSFFNSNRFTEDSKYDDIYLMPYILGAAKKVVYDGTPLYEFNRHEGNNSSWTTNFELLTPEILTEYLDVYRKRTEWLIKEFPEKKTAWIYYEESFWISMIDKVERYDLKACFDILDRLLEKMRRVKDEFLRNNKVKDFEKEYVRKYICE